ncbi:MAG: HAMP domain-containing histidine kinase [Pirellulales bacterium]|nr:HAMP domain-containing histidine kinase [Pirellulales bacterium]
MTACQNELEYLKQQLAHAQKLTALGQLVGTTTHEFNNVLTTIINYAKLGIRHKDEGTRDKALQKILAASERASKITNSVLGLARNRGDRFEATSLESLVEETLILLERELNKYKIVIERYFKEAPDVRANSNQIQQILLNLLINARQAMPGGGRVIIKIARDQHAPYVDLTVRDNGSGIPEDKLPRIFDAFYSTKSGPDASGKGGTGLGLSLAREIMEAHGGRIRVESTVGKGTAFTLKLPLQPTSDSPQDSAVATREDVTAKNGASTVRKPTAGGSPLTDGMVSTSNSPQAVS